MKEKRYATPVGQAVSTQNGWKPILVDRINPDLIEYRPKSQEQRFLAGLTVVFMLVVIAVVAAVMIL